LDLPGRKPKSTNNISEKNPIFLQIQGKAFGQSKKENHFFRSQTTKIRAQSGKFLPSKFKFTGLMSSTTEKNGSFLGQNSLIGCEIKRLTNLSNLHVANRESNQNHCSQHTNKNKNLPKLAPA